MQFFGNTPERCWIHHSHIKLWEKDDGESSKEVHGMRHEQKIPKRYEREWEPALRHADEAFTLSHVQRLGAFSCTFNTDGPGAPLLLFAARTLNTTGQSRVTLSLR